MPKKASSKKSSSSNIPKTDTNESQVEGEQNHHNNTQRNENHATPAVDVIEDEHDDITEESEKNARKTKEKKHDAGAADLERVTDFAEETEISASDISAVMGLIGQEVAGRLAKEKELLKVKIRKEDVELLVREFEISDVKAERHLREHAGSLIETLSALTT